MAVMVAGLLFARFQREDLLRNQLAQTEISGSQALWAKIVETGCSACASSRRWPPTTRVCAKPSPAVIAA